MTTIELEKRLTAVEEEIAALKTRGVIPPASPNHWVEKMAGTFSRPGARAAFDEAMRLGRQWREAQRPRAGKRKAGGK